MKNIRICLLKDFPSLEEGIFYLTGCTKSHLKKYKIPKSKLSKKIILKSEIEVPINLVNNGMINPTYSGESIRFIKETSDILAISKPVKVHSHPHSYHETDNVLSGIRAKGSSELLGVNFKNYDRGLLYRLDFETSGLLLYAKNQNTYEQVRSNFHTLLKKKKYLAVVVGNLKSKSGIVHYLTGYGPKKSLMQADTKYMEGSFEANINVKQLEYSSESDLSLIEVELFQGHRHQIRVQVAALGHPILGDPIYGNTTALRMFLHCYSYEINLNNEIHHFEDEFPKSFLNLFSSNG